MKTFSSSPPRFLKIFLFVGLSRAAQENSAPRIERNCLFGGGSRAAQEISAPRIERNCLFGGGSRSAQENSAPRIEKNCLFGGQPAWKQESAQRPIPPETSVSAAAHLPRNKRQRSGTFCPEQHPSVIDTPGIHRPAARYSLGDMPYLRRKRRMK